MWLFLLLLCSLPFAFICITFQPHFTNISSTFCSIVCCTLLLPCFGAALPSFHFATTCANLFPFGAMVSKLHKWQQNEKKGKLHQSTVVLKCSNLCCKMLMKCCEMRLKSKKTVKMEACVSPTMGDVKDRKAGFKEKVSMDSKANSPKGKKNLSRLQPEKGRKLRACINFNTKEECWSYGVKAAQEATNGKKAAQVVAK
ncbi:hypothetical protein SLEP1_g10204 [Rubroshorea leprosula]|uniref:Uncharacterized protein n=1 Tax=Rubroshorea leprosula TaxID=152421 RepID=A0AAV5IFW1_9ROSI|nr:hypothetical protein SLEP1_g10204 [Rubroshorea leprosula]